MSLNSSPIDVLEGRCRKGSERGGQQSPQQQRGLHGNSAAAVNTALTKQYVDKIYIPMNTYRGEGRGEGTNQQANEQYKAAP